MINYGYPVMLVAQGFGCLHNSIKLMPLLGLIKIKGGDNLFITIEFKSSELKGYSSEEDYANYIENKNIPIDKRKNIFTKLEVDKLNRILNKPLEVEEIKVWCLKDKDISKKTWFYGKDSKEKEKEYYKNYNSSEGLDLYLVKTSPDYTVDSDLLLVTTQEFETAVLYTITGSLKDIPSATQTSEYKVLDKLLSLEEKLAKFDSALEFNTKVGVHISDLGMLNVREVDVLEDACTDQLQDWLNEGWRILAVCPQPDSRRPDYILGRNEVMIDRKRRHMSCSCR